MLRCLLFGSSGFIGAHVRGLLAADAGVDLVISARPAIGGAAPRGAVAVLAGPAVDLATAAPATVTALLHDIAPDVVVNCAGVTGGDAPALVAGNVVAVSTLVRAVAAAAPAARLVHLGSAAEYGRVPAGVAVAESVPAAPLGTYGVTKLAGTALVGAAGLDAVVLRVFNPIGPGAPAGSLPGRLAAELRRGDGEVRVGSLAAHRDFVDVRDVAGAIVAAALAPGRLPPVVNIGSGRATPLREVADGLAGLAGGDQRISESAPGSARSADVPWQCADATLARATLGWTARTDLATSLRDLWNATA